MSTLDIIIISVLGIAFTLYVVLSIIDTIKKRKEKDKPEKPVEIKDNEQQKE